MNWLMVITDFKKNKVTNLVLLLFKALAACLAVISVITAIQTFTSISKLYDKAKPPHFVQMHKGEFNQEDLALFMANQSGLTHWQIQTMIGVFGSELTIVGDQDTYDLSDCRLDIGIVKQNANMDLLLDSKHEKVRIENGQIGMPVILKGMYELNIGDKVILSSNGVRKEFIIKEFILDSTMNSTIASSTRILISEDDFNFLNGQVGENEYLIEAYLTDKSEASNFQSKYENAGLPQNGEAITYSIIFLLSAITDITTVFVMLLVSLLLILVSFVCVKYTIMAALEEEIGEIGTMKAIGLPFTDIRELYLNKYKILALSGVILGYIMALLLSGVFTKHINTTFGELGLSTFAVISSVIIGVIVYLLIIHYCKKVLKKIRRVTVVDALVTGKGFDKEKGVIKDGLHKSKRIKVNWLLGIREVIYRFKNWSVIFLVVLIVVLMVLIPMNLLNTFEHPKFITYMGSSLEDILIEVENGEKLEDNYKKVRQVLESDSTITKYYEYRRVRAKTFDADNQIMNLHIDSGDNSGNALQYLSGRAPTANNEIAISYLNSEEMGKNTGDIIVLLLDDLKEQKFVISGIYQDVTSGGYTAKSIYDFNELSSQKYSFSVNIEKNTNIENKANEWTKIIGTGVTVDPMKEFINQTLGGVAKQLKIIVITIDVIGASLAILIAVLFLRLRLAKDSLDIAILKAIGFSDTDVIQQYMTKMGGVTFTGILVGIIFTNVLGNKIVNFALSVAGIGIKNVTLMINPVIQYILCPILLLILILVVTRVVMKTAKGYSIHSITN